jgi:hypothetical protein
MLDNFYFAEGLSRAIQAKVQAGAVCTGFYTKHNEDRWAKRFKPFVYCPVDYHEDYGHDGGVNRCLGSYLRETACR